MASNKASRLVKSDVPVLFILGGTMGPSFQGQQDPPGRFLGAELKGNSLLAHNWQGAEGPAVLSSKSLDYLQLKLPLTLPSISDPL